MNKNDIPNEEALPTKVTKALAKMGDDEKIALSSLPAVPEIDRILYAYPEEMRDKVELTRTQVEKILRNTKISTFGVNNTLPLICKNDDCSFTPMCIFYKMGIAPEGEACADEIMYLDAMIPQLIKDMTVDMENYLEVSMVQEYAGALLDKRRAERMIAIEGDVKEVPMSVIQQTGTVVYVDQITPYVDIKEKASKKLAILRRELLATREQRAKYKMTDTVDPSTKASELREKFLEITTREQEDTKQEKKSLDEAFSKSIDNDAN